MKARNTILALLNGKKLYIRKLSIKYLAGLRHCIKTKVTVNREAGITFNF